MNTDKILYLHIGMPKTGTSSLQLFLMQNPEALAQNNCSYPMMPGRYPMVSPNRNAHFLVGKIMNADGSADMEKTKEIEKQSFELLEQVFQRTDRVILSDEAIWNTPEAYYYYNGGTMDWSVYRWTERDNPCHPSYYMDSDRAAACNVFASNLGINCVLPLVIFWIQNR